ncbi:MAG: RNA polymerase sigma factor [Gemmatimonadota bacterium]
MADAELSDATLVARAREGDESAFEKLVRRHYRAAFSIALSRLGNRMDAEDVCQDAFIKALDRLDDCRDPSRFAGWLLQIVRNTAHNTASRSRLRNADELDERFEAGSGKADAARELELGELGERLESALQELTPTQREVVLLHDLEGWEHRRIAGVVGCSEVMSRQHLFQARRRLREILGRDAVSEHMHD